ncbi:MAG: DUF2721 domain-containing protein [Reinekea forsetii]|jgi:hypothetical protein|nr:MULTISPECIES: DUF2721 domain-containing protein [Reinekea]MDB9895086.1 DUF2721 domain-containing protein [Reinekea forsetii]MDO7642518.1 DUF2721 domain-containing protein [Reinekea forsetii]MDO7674303.1 DUF2721 domain-containing protein [Reinekea forsetii]
MSLTTPALLFPAISLLLLAYTNRFLVITQLIRSLYKQNDTNPDLDIRKQILHLRVRIIAIRRMQVAGISSFILCVVTMFAIFVQQLYLANIFFAGSMVLLLVSLFISLYEVQISGQALQLQLKNLEQLSDD